MSQPVALTINVHDLDTPNKLPAALEARLNGSPTKSPEDLATTLQAHANRTASLRQAHIDAVRDRAARESQRAADAVARKLRLEANRVDKIQSRHEAAANKIQSRNEAAEAEREARKARREGLAQAVAEARQAASQARATRHAELATAEALANTKHMKALIQVKSKGAAAVKHALAVAAANKQKEAEVAALIAEKQFARLNAADCRREHLATLALNGPASPGKEKASAKAARALNESFNAAALKRIVHEAQMNKADANRAAHLKAIRDKAANVSVKAAAVVAKANDKADALQATKLHMYDRLLRAEVARLSALKAKYSTNSKDKVNDVIVVQMDVTPRSPPSALVLRLATVSTGLVTTSKARQEAATARRNAWRQQQMIKLSKANERRAMALKRVAQTIAAVKAKLQAKASRALITHALTLGARQHRISQAKKRTQAALEKRETMAATRLTLKATRQEAAKAAAERHAAVLRKVAKVGVVAVRAAAHKNRREAIAKTVHNRFLVKAQRSAQAASTRAALLAVRIDTAKKHMKPMHPKREMPDEEVTSTSSEA